MKTYIITAYTNFTIILKAKNKTDAIRKAAKIHLVMYDEPATKDIGLEAELIENYLNEEDFLIINN